jgi:hypothetical protein
MSSHRDDSFQTATPERMSSRVPARQGGSTAANPGVAFQAQVKPGLLHLLRRPTGGGVRIPRLTVGDVCDDAQRDLFVGATARVNRIVPPDCSQVPGFLDRELGSSLSNAQDLVWAQDPEVGSVPCVQGVPDEVLQHGSGSSQLGQKPVHPVVNQVCWVATAGI